MTEIPEWFELTADDQKPEAPKSKKRSFKLALLAAPLVLVGGAMVFADGDAEADDIPAINTSTTSQSSQATEQVAPTTGSTIAAPAATKSVGVPAPGAQGAPGGDDDHDGFRPEREDDDHDGFRPEGGEHHERGENEQKGSAPQIPTSGTATTKN